MTGSTAARRLAVERAIARHNAAYLVKSARAVVLARIGTLTPREWQVFGLITRGDTNKHVARALGTTERTIKAHRHNVMEKMQVQSLAELVSLAERVGVHELAAGQTSLGISDRQVPQCEDRSPPPR
jgi:FixJ family two-component response regulator